MPLGFLKYTALLFVILIQACPSKEKAAIAKEEKTIEAAKVSESNYAEGIAHCKAVFDNMLKTTGSASSTADCLIGYDLPDFEVTTMSGKKVSNNSLKGKITIINFWFTKCRPCVAEIPGFNQIIDKYGRENFNYISIGRDSEEEVTEFLIKNPWKFDHIVDAESLIRGEFMFMWGFPTTMLVDSNGTIIHAINRGKSGPGAAEHLKRRLTPHLDKAIAQSN